MGREEVRDWTSVEVIGELHAGDAVGGDERQVYLFANQGKSASAPQFRASGKIGSAVPANKEKDVSDASTARASAATEKKAAKPASESVLARYPDSETPTVPANDEVMFVGLHTRQPGAAVGTIACESAFVANSPLIALPLLGRFGDG